MISRKQRHRLALAAAVGSLVSVSGVFAAASWSGNGDTNASGNWNTAENWTGSVTGGVPGADAADNPVVLGNVTEGVRTIRVDASPVNAIRGISFVQTTEGAVNKLAIDAGASLTLTNGGSMFGNAAAQGAGSVVIDVNGNLVLTTGNFSAGNTLAHTFNFGNGGWMQYNTLSTGASIIVTGVLNVDAGPGGNASISSSGTGTSNPLSVHARTGGQININSGTLNIVSTAANNGAPVSFSTTNDAFATIADGATLALLGSNISGSKSVTIDNGGLLAHGGRIQLRPVGATPGSPSTIRNDGTWAVTGANARIEQLVGAGNVPIVTFTNNGTLTGSGMLTLSNAESAAVIAVTNAGVIDPGANGVGKLTIAGSNLAFSPTTGTLTIDAASAASHDSLNLAGTLSLAGTGDVLNLTLVEGFTPASGTFTLENVLTYSSLAGTFETYLVNGQASPWSIQLIDHGASADLVVAVPEPGSLGLLALAGLGLTRRRRRLK